MLVPFGQYSPDQPPFQNPGSDSIVNVLPVTADSYGPAPSLASITGALDARCQGAIFTKDNAANTYGYAGDATKLYEYGPGSLSWVDESGMTPYNTLPEERWAFTVYGELVIATNYTDPIQAFTVNSSSAFADLSAGAPNARYSAVVKDFVMVANTNDGIDGPVPQRVWWSAINDPTNWPVPGTIVAAQLMSDYNDLAGDGGWNQGIVGGLSGADVIILQEKRVWRAMFVGPPIIFTFDVIEGARGCPAPGSIVSVGPICYYLADNGFYACDGVSSRAIGDQRVDQTFWATVDQAHLHRVTAAADPLKKIIYWAYPGPQNEGGQPNRVLCYHYGVDRWTSLILDVDVLTRSYSQGYTMDQLDIFGTMESMPQISLDSRTWTGGLLSLSGFTSTNTMGNFSGPSLEAAMDTSEAQLNDKGRASVTRVWPMADTSAALISVGARANLYEQPTWTTPAPLSASTATVPVRSNNVYHRGRMVIPAGTEWTSAQGIMMDATPAGRR